MCNESNVTLVQKERGEYYVHIKKAYLVFQSEKASGFATRFSWSRRREKKTNATTLTTPPTRK